MTPRDIERVIAGALKSAIDAHGPITRERIGSAAKRVRCQLASSLRCEGGIYPEGWPEVDPNALQTKRWPW